MTLESVYHRNTVNSRVMMSAHMRQVTMNVQQTQTACLGDIPREDKYPAIQNGVSSGQWNIQLKVKHLGAILQ